jgi:hypothetical protein
MKKEVNLCDNCDHVVATDKCTFCSADSCGKCLNKMSFTFTIDSMSDTRQYFEIGSCMECKARYRKISLGDGIAEEIKKIIINHLKKVGLVEAMEGKTEEMIDYSTFTSTLSSSYPYTQTDTHIPLYPNPKNNGKNKRKNM